MNKVKSWWRCHSDVVIAASWIAGASFWGAFLANVIMG